MTVVFLTRNYPPTFCGVGDFTAHIAREFRALGVRTHIICDVGQEPGEGIYPIMEHWHGTGFRPLMAKLAEIRPDWVVMQYVPHTFHPKGLPMGLLGLYDQLSGKGYRVFTFFHEIQIRPERRLATRVVSFLQKLLAKRLLRKSASAATSIDRYARLLNEMGCATELGLIPIGTNILPQEVTPAELALLRKRYGIAEGSTVVASFGNRDVTPFLADFDRLAATVPGLVWLIFGKSKTPAEVLQGRKYIRYAGSLPATDIYKGLCLADVFFSPDEIIVATGEGGSCNKSTALACGLSLGVPVVGVLGDMNNALLRHEENILLVDTGREFALYEAVIACIKPSELATRLGKNAKLLYENHLCWETLAAKHLALMPASPAGLSLKMSVASSTAVVGEMVF